MNLKVMKLAALVLVTFVALNWLRADGVFDFDIRSIVPFMRGDVTVHDWGGLALIGLGIWGFARLQRQTTGGGQHENTEKHDQFPPAWPADDAQYADEDDE